jgi:hypothetical protein
VSSGLQTLLAWAAMTYALYCEPDMIRGARSQHSFWSVFRGITSTREEVTQGCRRLHNEEFHNSYSSLSNIVAIRQ